MGMINTLTPTMALCQTVNLTPAPPMAPTPVPYPNTGELAAMTPATTKLQIGGAIVATLGTKGDTSLGDQPGSQGGVISGTTGGAYTFADGSSRFTVQGHAVTDHTVQLRMNGNNAIGALPGPTQEKVSVAP